MSALIRRWAALGGPRPRRRSAAPAAPRLHRPRDVVGRACEGVRPAVTRRDGRPARARPQRDRGAGTAQRGAHGRRPRRDPRAAWTPRPPTSSATRSAPGSRSGSRSRTRRSCAGSSSRARRPGSRRSRSAPPAARLTPRSRTAIERDGIEAFVAEWEQQPMFASHAALPPGRAVPDPRDPPRQRPGGPRREPPRAGQGSMEPLFDRLSAIDRPTLVIAGALDDRGRPRAERVAAGIPGARLAVVDGAGHTPHDEQPRPSDASPSTSCRRTSPHDRPRHLDPRRRLRGHPLRALRHRDRQGHDQPAAGPQRVPAADRARADRRVRPDPRRRRRSAACS